MSEALLKTPEVARILGVAEITLRKWRIVGGGAGPCFVKCGRLVRYKEDDVDGWIASRTAASTSEAA